MFSNVLADFGWPLPAVLFEVPVASIFEIKRLMEEMFQFLLNEENIFVVILV